MMIPQPSLMDISENRISPICRKTGEISLKNKSQWKETDNIAASLAG